MTRHASPLNAILLAALIFSAVGRPAPAQPGFTLMTTNEQPTSPAGSARYDEPYRPQFHFTPAQNFMNDPNGLVYYKGEYHLFYQHNPFANVWGHMGWGHAVSRDLVHWRHLPVALREENGVMIFSGSAVVDWRNTSGLCQSDDPNDPSCLIAIYTGHSTEPNGKVRQNQNIAFSNDRGRTWTKHDGNPVLDINYSDFRDPKVFWHAATKRWIMIVSLSAEQKAVFYGSRDLRKWERLSDFGPAGATGGLWECPDLFQLPVEGESNRKKWVLIVNINPGGVAGGSGAQYFIGEFDGVKFTNDHPPDRQLWADYGKDFYAAVSWSDVPPADGRRILIGWMSNWQYAGAEPTTPFRGAQSIPRVVTLKKLADGVRLIQSPITELKSLRAKHFSLRDVRLKGIEGLPAAQGAEGDALEIIAEFEPGTASEFGLRARKGGAQETLVGYDVKRRELFVDRTRSGHTNFDEHFPGRRAAAMLPINGKVRLHIFIDRSSIEVFGNDGARAITERIFPDPHSRGLELYASGGESACAALDVWQLKSAWK